MDSLLIPDPGLVFWTTISFGILVFILKKYAWGPILQALKVRNETIEQSLLTAERAKAEIKDLVKTRQVMMDETKAEQDELLKETRGLKDKILEEAKHIAHQEADKIIVLAREQIQNEKSAAIKDLKKHVVELSVDIAGLLIESELSTDLKQKVIIDKYLDGVSFN